MMRTTKRPLTLLAVLVAALALLATACSSDSGGKKADEEADLPGAGTADTPRMTIAMIHHAPAGDTFWDIIRKGAEAAAAKDNVDLMYNGDVDISEQSTLVQNAINQKVDGIAVTLPNAEGLSNVLAQAEDAGIPVVAFNAGVDDWQDVGAMEFFGQEESLAGEQAGQRLSEEGAGKVLCVLQAQGQVQLEARCDGVASGFDGEMEKLYVNGEDMPSVRSTITAKLQEDDSIDHVVTLGAPIAMTAIQSVADAGSEAKVVTFDTNPEVVDAIGSGDVQWAIDQQPYLQGYLAVDSLWLYNTNGNVIGGGNPVLTGPAFIDESTLEEVAEYAQRGTR
jgi:simple sugar transport system substrate-binding protein